MNIGLLLLLLFAAQISFFTLLLFYTQARIVRFDRVAFARYTLVLGAGLEKNSLPTDILADRLETAINLCKTGKTEILVLSGSTGSQNDSEPLSMKTYVVSRGIDPSHLILDYNGKSTFDSLKNLSNFKDLDTVTIVSQRFHLPRSIWLAAALGLNAQGTPANTFNFSFYKTFYWYLREVFALPLNLIKIVLNYASSENKYI